MGMEKVIAFEDGPPPWATIMEKARGAGLALTIRMIDGMPAFPDEVPEPSWREVRVSSPAGMMTLRRVDQGVAVVVWGNADEPLRNDWETLARLFSCEYVLRNTHTPRDVSQ
jgi:hypothetical protein